MKRREFIEKCGIRCLGVMAGAAVLNSCLGVKYVSAPINGSFMEVPEKVFEIDKEGTITYRKYVVLENDQLQYPIAVFRTNKESYQGVWMRCTHQGTELQLFGDRFQCPAHGSEFTKVGEVKNGPAETNLRSFPVTVSNQLLKINLS
jgi:Rieske Fe-S protein